MKPSSHIPALLPSGLFDQLAPLAEEESRLTSSLLNFFRQSAYQHVQPPLMEFSASLLGKGEESELARQSFRVMDPLSQQMLALRPDMTMQIARIAGSTLAGAPRPLRLCYAGQTLRTLPDAVRTARQFRQIGIELFGSDSYLADVEVIQLAVTGLQQQGIMDLTIDLSMPDLLSRLLSDTEETHREDLIQAIAHKDIAAIERFGHSAIASLSTIAEPASSALDKLRSATLPSGCEGMIRTLEQTIETVNNRLEGDVQITVDPLEMRGFGYHHGISFSLFARENQQEVGRGGRYVSAYGEPATGFTLYTEDLLPLMAKNSQQKQSILVPTHCPSARLISLQAQGYHTGYALSDSLTKEAKRLKYNHILSNDLTSIQEVDT